MSNRLFAPKQVDTQNSGFVSASDNKKQHSGGKEVSIKLSSKSEANKEREWGWFSFAGIDLRRWMSIMGFIMQCCCYGVSGWFEKTDVFRIFSSLNVMDKELINQARYVFNVRINSKRCLDIFLKKIKTMFVVFVVYNCVI